MNRKFVARLKELRGNMSQEEFATRTGTKQTSYSCWERGEKDPSISVLYQISTTFGVSADWLLGLSDVREPTQGAAPAPVVTKSRQKVCEPQFDYLTKFAALEQRVKALEAAAIIELNRPTAACCG